MKHYGKLLAAALMLVSGTALQAQGPRKGPAPKQVVSVGRVTEEMDLENRKFTGLVLSPSVVHLTPRVEGEIIEVGFKDGAPVKKGQVLYRLDDVKYRAAVMEAEAKVEEYRAKVKYAQQNYDRVFSLYGKKAATLDSKENAESVLAAFKASLHSAEANLITAKENLEDCTIVSPIDGIAGTTRYTLGNYLTPSSGTLVTVLQSDPIRVRFPMSIRLFLNMFRDLSTLRSNGIVKTILADDTMYPEEGNVELIDNEANKNTDSILVYVLFKNPKGILIPNGTVTVEISRKSAEKKPSVIPSAILHDSKGSYVYMVNPTNTVTKRYVVLGGTNGKYQIIEKGLKAGELIVVDGTQKLYEGAPIEYAPAVQERK